MDNDLKKIINHYDDLYLKYGYSDKSIGWGKSRKYLRYYILCHQFNLSQKSIIDFGCGFGDLYKYLKRSHDDFEYIGIDINENLIKEAKIQYPDADFVCKNIFIDKLEKKYDYIVSSGVHNTKIKDNISYIEKTMALFNDLSSCGFAMNFLSNNVDYMEQNLFYTDPSRIMQLALQYSNNILIRHDYMPYEFTVIVTKNKKIDNNLNVYEDYIQKL